MFSILFAFMNENVFYLHIGFELKCLWNGGGDGGVA